MPLNVGQLTNDIRGVFEAQLDSSRDIASRIARAYESYARLAQAPPGVPVVLKGSEVSLLERGLLQVMEQRLLAPAAAQTVGAAVVSFWLTPPVAAGPGVVTAVIPQSGIAKMLGTNVSTAAQAAQSLASSLDLITRTVFVTAPPPAPSGVLF